MLAAVTAAAAAATAAAPMPFQASSMSL